MTAMNTTQSSGGSGRLPLVKKFIYGILAVVLILSLMSLPLRTSMIREVWFKSSPLDEEPSANPWIYSIVGGLELLHIAFLIFAFSAVYDESAPKAFIAAIVFIFTALVLVISLVFLNEYAVVFVSIPVYITLGAVFAIYGQYVMYEDIPIEFVVRTKDGKTSPLLP